MRHWSPRVRSSARARSRRRANTAGEREGSWAEPMRNAEVGMCVASGGLRGVEVVSWPDDIRTHEQRAAPAPGNDARVVFPTRKAKPAVAAVEVDTPLTVEKNQAVSVLHIRVERPRPAAVV